MARRKFDLIVFDWDGTLMDSTATIVKCIQASARDLGLAIPDDKTAASVIGLGLHEALQLALPDLAVQHYSQVVERYRYHYCCVDQELILFDGVREMLTDLSQQGYLLAIATGKSRAGLSRSLEATGIANFFDASRCADETFSKPHPAMLLELTQELGQARDRTVMIGDTTHDLNLAKNAGTSAVAVEYGAHPIDELLALEPIYLANSVPQLHGWLNVNA